MRLRYACNSCCWTKCVNLINLSKNCYSKNSKGNPWLENANSLSSISSINQRAQPYNRHSVLLHSCSGSPYSRITWHWAKTQIICCESTINPNSSSAKPESKPLTLSPKTIASADYQLLRLSLSSFPPPHSLFSFTLFPYLRCRCEEQVSCHSVFTGYLYFFKPTASRPHHMTSSSSPPCAFAVVGSHCRYPARGKVGSQREGGWGVWGELTHREWGGCYSSECLWIITIIIFINDTSVIQCFCECGEKEGGREKCWWYYDKAKVVHIYMGRWVELIQKPGCGCVTGRPCLKASDYIYANGYNKTTDGLHSGREENADMGGTICSSKGRSMCLPSHNANI